MKKILSITIILISMVLSGCATGGTKLVNLYYTGTSDTHRSGKIGISPFVDQRGDTEGGSGYVGTRYIGKRTKEIFSANGSNVASSVTGICLAYLQDIGFNCTSVASWEHSPDGVMDSGRGFTYLVGGEIKKFDCFAVKKIGFTSMTLEISMVIYLGDTGKKELKRIPIELKLERQEITFSKAKLEKFLNESLAEMIKNALPFKEPA